MELNEVWTSGGVVRLISIDPGLSNVGLCVLDWCAGPGGVTQTLVAMKNHPLPDAVTLSWKHFKNRLEWVGVLNDSIHIWLTRYVIPRMRYDVPVILVVEENDLTLTRDWAPLAIAHMGIFANVIPVTVIPTVVHKWMINQRGMVRGVNRGDKKLHTKALFVDWLKDGKLDDTFNICEHSVDAWVNSQHLIERMTRKKSNKKNKHQSECLSSC